MVKPTLSVSIPETESILLNSPTSPTSPSVVYVQLTDGSGEIPVRQFRTDRNNQGSGNCAMVACLCGALALTALGVLKVTGTI
jgi:hypothetical protein